MNRIVTFYSYKGGVGRTFALANVAVLLAQRGKRVLVIDWDLEAPGLHRYFKRYVQPPVSTDGVIHLLGAAARETADTWRPFVTKVRIPNVAEEISLIAAGDQASDYTARARDFSWERFFNELHGGAILDRWRSEWRNEFDFTLIDSRTGITDSGGVCTVYLPDILVFVFTANEQSFDCGIQIINAIQQSRQNLAVRRSRAAVLPLPGRFDGRDEVDEANRWLGRFAEELRPFYDDWLPQEFKPRQLLEITKVPYITKFSFGEPLPVLTHGITNPEFPGFYLDKVTRLLASDFQDAAQMLAPEKAIEAPGNTATFMFIDVASGSDSVGLSHADAERLRSYFVTHKGYEVNAAGDSFFIAFARPSDAVLCAVAIQRSFTEERLMLDGDGLALRIGMHTGTASATTREGRTEYDGHAVNIAARVERLHRGGGRIYTTRETSALAGELPRVRYHSHGRHLLKGVAERVEVIEILWDREMQPAAPEDPDNRLPYPWLTQWIGRGREMRALRKALQQYRLVTLHGLGGVGKTRLAVETLLSNPPGVPGEVVFIPLERVSDDEQSFLNALREGLGFTEHDASDFDTLCKRLRGNELLLVLDNFETVQGGSAMVTRLLAVPEVRVLVTSRALLQIPSEYAFALEPMDRHDTAALFIELAQRRDGRWTPDDDEAFQAVLSATEGLPYVIELVAAIAPKRRLRQLADELRGGALDQPGHSSVAGVQVALDWTLNRLPDAERAALRRLSIFKGTFEAQAAEQIAEASMITLDVLVDASLIRFDRDLGRYALHPILRQYLRTQVTEAERDEVASRHGQWYVTLLNYCDDLLRSGEAERQSQGRLIIQYELENIQQALTWAESHDAHLFGFGVMAFQVYLSQTYRFSEIIRLNELLLQRLEPHSQQWAIAQLNLARGLRQLPTGNRAQNIQRAIVCYHAALDILSRNEDRGYYASALTQLGRAYAAMPTDDRSEALRKAIECYESALSLLNESENPSEVAATQNALGNALQQLTTGDASENLTKAIAYYEAALKIATEESFPVEWAMTQNNIGNVYRELSHSNNVDNLAKAVVCYEAALRVFTETDFPAQWAYTQNQLGLTLAQSAESGEERNLHRAIACFEAALRVQSERDDPYAWAMTHFNIGRVLASISDDQQHPQAVAHFEASLRGFSAVGLTREAEVVRRLLAGS